MKDTQKQTIVVTGGAGYIGSHTAWHLNQQGYDVVIIDNFTHNQPWEHSWARVIRGDIGNEQLLEQVFTAYTITAVMHFAAYIEVGKSVADPASYYHNNVINTLKLLDAMRRHNVATFIFSSSCAVYGMPQQLPLTEDHPKNPISPYGTSKLMVEHVLHDYAQAYGLRYGALRYFNAAGALPEYDLGEIHEPETHVIPLLLRAAMEHTTFRVFGTDHTTSDGTCIRDYVHVVDIADAHVKALQYLQVGNVSEVFNLGTGSGYSVQELITAVEKLCTTKLSINYAPKRLGDPAVLVADARKAQQILGWQPNYPLEAILQSAYEFAQHQNHRILKQKDLASKSH